MENKTISKNTPTIEVEIPGFKVLGFTKVYGTDDILVKVRFENQHLRLKKTVTLSMREVQNAREFRKRIPPSFAIPDVKPSHQIEMLCYAINQALNRSGTTVGEALPQGFSFVGDELFYVIGDRVLPTASNIRERFIPSEQYGGFVSSKPHKRSIPGNRFVAENPDGAKFLLSASEAMQIEFKQSIEWIRALCKMGPASAVLLLCALTPYLKYVLPNADTLGSIVNAYIVGDSGVGKTSLALLVSGVTDIGYGVNLESDMDQILALPPDRAILIDDLNRSASPSQKAKKEDKLSKLIQMTFSAGDISSKGIDVDISNNALLISGEYALENPSSINRCVLLRIHAPFDSNTLTYLQKEKVLYALFVDRFISFLCRDYKRIKTELEKFCNEEIFPMPNAGSESEYFGSSRINRHNKILRLTAYAVTIFLRDERIDLEECNRIYGILTKGIAHCIDDTLKEVSKKPVSDVVRVFLESFQEKGLIAKTPKKYFSKLDTEEERLFFLYEDQLYFKGEKLARYLSDQLPYTVSVRVISRDLGNANLLAMYGNSFSEELPSSLKRDYKKKGHFFRVDVKYLCEVLYNRYRFIGYNGLPIADLLKEKDEEK